MAVLSLPTELLQRIAKETIPEDFENFALTCTNFHNASGIFLEQHNRLRKQFRNFKFSSRTKVIQGRKHGVNRDEICSSSMELLAKIAACPLIARYIVSANLDENLFLNYFTNPLLDQGKDFLGVLAMLEKSPYLKDAGIDPKSMFTTMMNQFDGPGGHVKEYSGLATAFLLTLLPNATSLTLASDYERDLDSGESTSSSKLAIFFDAIIIRANDPLYPTASLSRLTSIRLFTGWGYNYWYLSTSKSLLSINSVRNFYGGGCINTDDRYTNLPFDIDIPPCYTLASGVEVVELAGACVDGEELTRFLSWLPKLKTFKLSYAPKWNGSGYDWDAVASMTSIEETVGDKLEGLSFSILNRFGYLTSAVTSLKRFRKLKYLELDLTVLRSSRTEHVWREPRGGGDGDAALDVQRLSDLLPATIETIRLLADGMNDDYAMNCLFSNVAADKDTKLPNLKNVTICTAGENKKLDHSNEELDVGDIEVEPNDAESLKKDAEIDVPDERTIREKPSRSNSAARWKENLLALEPSVKVEQIVYSHGQINSFVKDWTFVVDE